MATQRRILGTTVRQVTTARSTPQRRNSINVYLVLSTMKPHRLTAMRVFRVPLGNSVSATGIPNQLVYVKRDITVRKAPTIQQLSSVRLVSSVRTARKYRPRVPQDITATDLASLNQQVNVEKASTVPWKRVYRTQPTIKLEISVLRVTIVLVDLLFTWHVRLGRFLTPQKTCKGLFSFFKLRCKVSEVCPFSLK